MKQNRRITDSQSNPDKRQIEKKTNTEVKIIVEDLLLSTNDETVPTKREVTKIKRKINWIFFGGTKKITAKNIQKSRNTIATLVLINYNHNLLCQ